MKFACSRQLPDKFSLSEGKDLHLPSMLQLNTIITGNELKKLEPVAKGAKMPQC